MTINTGTRLGLYNYSMQLLAFAQGAPYEKLGFERQRLKPDLTRYPAAVPS